MMHIKNIILSLTAILSIISTPYTHAAPKEGSPEEVVTNMLTELKEEADPSVLLNYVHWPTAWENFPTAQRDKIGVSSPQDLKEYFESFFRDPDDFIENYVMSRYKGSQKLPEASIAKMAESMKRKKSQMEQKMKNTSYSIGESSVQGNAATVEVVSNLDGRTKTQTLPLQKIDGKWYLPTMKMLEDSQQPATRSSGQ